MKTEMYWHCHHNILCEYVWDYDERVEAIKEKPSNEVKIRLRLFKKVKGKLPKEFVEAWEKFDEVRNKYFEAKEKLNEARKKFGEARKKLVEAEEKYKPQLEKLHKKECGCKEWNGKEIEF